MVILRQPAQSASAGLQQGWYTQPKAGSIRNIAILGNDNVVSQRDRIGIDIR
jgi:hypothetical protein